MKAGIVIAKNLKLLFRNKESAFTIIFGPLLIILLVSAAYTGGRDDGTIRVGTYAPEYTGLADDVISALKNEGYLVSTFTSEDECVEPIKTAELHTCIIFPPDFRIKENETNEVTFSVDYSRVNLVYQIIEGLAEQLNLQSEVISQGIAADLLDRVTLAQQEIHGQLSEAASLDSETIRLRQDLVEGRQELGDVEVNVTFADLKEIRGSVAGLSSLITEIRDESLETMEGIREDLDWIDRSCDNCSSEVEDIIDQMHDDLENATLSIQEIAEAGPDRVQEVGYLIDDAAAAMSKVQLSYEQLVSVSGDVEARLAASTDDLSALSDRFSTLRGKLQHVDQSLQRSIGLSAEGVSSPITTRIQAVNTEESNLAFTYPYVLMLVIMFLGLMINSTLIVMDKTSKAAFRNFTTATRDEYHILMSFLTTGLILLMQTLIILLVSYFFVKASLFNNFGVSLLIILFAITLFSFLGMILGYLAGTHEAAMIASLSLGSVLLFISNLVLPLESMNRVVQVLSIYNPYVVLSELLKQSMLFNLSLVHVPVKIGILVAMILVLLLLIFGVQRSFRRRYFQRRSGGGARGPQTKAVKPLEMGKRQAKDLFDLLEALDSMTRAEFEDFVTSKKNPVAEWVKDEVGERRLARKLKTKSKERMILALDNFLKKRTKQLEKG